MAQRAPRRGRTGTKAQHAADRDPRPASARTRPKRPGRGPGPGTTAGGRTRFDGFAEHITQAISSSYFFAFCAAAILTWAFFGPRMGYSANWQGVINTSTAIVTLLMVALLQNAQRRSEKAINHKLDAIAEALADFMDKADIELEADVRELEDAIGLEKREGISGSSDKPRNSRRG